MKEIKLRMYLVPFKKLLSSEKEPREYLFTIVAYSKKEAIKIAIEYCSYKTDAEYITDESIMLKNTKVKLKNKNNAKYFTDEMYQKQFKFLDKLRKEYEERGL